MSALTDKDRILGGLWGAVVGDAMGVPVEFQSREMIRRNPVTDLREFGMHQQPKGTWSDDSSLMLCTVDSLLAAPFDVEDMGRRFVAWEREGLWTPWGRVFDIGISTRAALARIHAGTPAAEAGGRDEHSNGNGSLMRILPVSLRFCRHGSGPLLDHVHRASAITHGHARALMACGFHSLLVAGLLQGKSPADACAAAADVFCRVYAAAPFKRELPHFERVLTDRLLQVPETEIPSTGYVVHTLVASVWCLRTSQTFEETVLKAVNLGHDTDTTGTVAGGLAGLHFGLAAVPERWRKAMARAGELEQLFARFAEAVESAPA